MRNLVAEIRSEAATASRAGQMARLEGIADSLEAHEAAIRVAQIEEDAGIAAGLPIIIGGGKSEDYWEGHDDAAKKITSAIRAQQK